MVPVSEDAVDALNILVDVTEKSGKLRSDLKQHVLKAVSSHRNVFVSLKSEVENTNRLIVDLEIQAVKTNSMLEVLRAGVGGNCREKQEATYLGLQAYYKDNDGRAVGPVCKTRRRYSDVMMDKRPGGGQKDASTAQTDQSKVKGGQNGATHQDTNGKATHKP
jgi:hypothetical protein